MSITEINLRAIAYGFRKGKQNGGVDPIALADFLDSVNDELKKLRANNTAQLAALKKFTDDYLNAPGDAVLYDDPLGDVYQIAMELLDK